MIRLLIFTIVLTAVVSQRFKKIYTPTRDLRFRKLATYRALKQLPFAGLQSTRRQTDFRFDKVGECPRYTNRRSCVNEFFFTFCTSDYDCSGQQKCCMYGCGRERRCTEAVNVPNGCMYRGEKYPEMSTFPAPDGCNKCRCEGGQVTCSKTKCVEEKPSRCTEPLKRGYCRDSITRFWYNPEQQKCESFDYSGCYGNRNNFETLQDCMIECQAEG
ncbi:kunitz-type protease inhibitor 1-like isoform X3 [Crassostrea angulata]|uniref:kunitz-type protease inhibitor 1-like isoform X3 n=1 Tax=Magallana angulata TaxID=2784310 RepID=UPI0022B139D4|nr:kunitz-type protease inhibitor 1-like isoform X3 [Crassostrea angulata]